MNRNKHATIPTSRFRTCLKLGLCLFLLNTHNTVFGDAPNNAEEKKNNTELNKNEPPTTPIDSVPQSSAIKNEKPRKRNAEIKDEFIPTEEISKDLSVSFPADI